MTDTSWIVVVITHPFAFTLFLVKMARTQTRRISGLSVSLALAPSQLFCAVHQSLDHSPGYRSCWLLLLGSLFLLFLRVSTAIFAVGGLIEWSDNRMASIWRRIHFLERYNIPFPIVSKRVAVLLQSPDSGSLQSTVARVVGL